MSRSDDPRMGTLVQKGNTGDVVIVGFANHEGVTRNGGRMGAMYGPQHFRQAMHKMGTVVNPEFGVDLKVLQVRDAGDASGDTLEDTHANLTQIVQGVIAQGGTPFVVGGGNDQSYPNALALIQHFHLENPDHKIAVINIDAHLDVRPLIDGKCHSGSPFRLLLENESFQKVGTFVEFAAQGSQCSAEHVDWLKSRGGVIQWLSEIANDPVTCFRNLLTQLEASNNAIFVSFDIDSITGADCPGVSCVATVGLSSADALNMMRISGESRAVRIIDLSELNPSVEDHRTPRLVANMFYSFLIGRAKLKKTSD
eukprot:c872_g1_i1.p1 GENE.c872_g1_i1~~c872_g1_i1.p1  ORF type:complete len:318 (-),score=83.38 c872_g1_i1:168-1100(-)